MGGKSSTFAVIDLNRSMRWPVETNRTNDALTLALDKLFKCQCQLVSMTTVRNRFQASIQFESVADCLEAVGEFARASFSASKLALPARIGIATGEAGESTRPEEHPAHRRAHWLAGLASDPAILMSEVTAFLSRDLELHPYGVDEFGNFFNVELGESAAVYCLLHPQIAVPRKVDDETQKHNIPPLNEFFIGRLEEIDEISNLLERKTRVISLFGPSGVGKTTLARRVGYGVVDQYRHGVKYADLSDAKDRNDILAKIFSSINLPIDHLPRLSLDMLRRHFGDRKHLIILDGCDNVVKHLLPLVKPLLETRHVQILTTSIYPLDLPEAHDMLIEDFPLPPQEGIPTIKELQQIDSCALLIDGIEKYRQGRPPLDSEVPEIIELVRMVNGNAMSIYLASRRLRTESLREIIKSYDSAAKGVPERNPSVEATLAGLDKFTRMVLQYSSIFFDPWSRDELAETMDVPAAKLTETLEQLRLLGLITELSEDHERGLFKLSPHFRNGVRSALAAEGKLEEFREMHALAILNRLRESLRQIEGPGQRTHLDKIDRYRRDFEEALRYLIEKGRDPSDFIEAMRLSWTYWYRRNRLRSVMALADLALEKCLKKDVPMQARLLMLQAIFTTKAGRSPEAIELLRRAFALIQRTKELYLKAQIQINLGIALWADLQPEESVKAYDKALLLADEIENDDLRLSIYTGVLAPLIDLRDLDRVRKAIDEFSRVVAASDDPFDQWNLAIAKAEYWCEFGDQVQARKQITTALKVSAYIYDPALIGRAFLWKSRIELEACNFEEAARDLGRCLYHMNTGEHALYEVNLHRIYNLNTALVKRLGSSVVNELKMQGAIDIE